MKSYKIYKISWQDPNLGHCLAWSPTKYDAERKTRELQTQYEGYSFADITITPVEIAHQKAGLCVWLNANFTTDNG